MKKPLTIVFGLSVCLFIFYLVQHDARLSASNNTKSIIKKVAGQTLTQDSVQAKAKEEDPNKLVSRKVISNDINPGDIFVGNK